MGLLLALVKTCRELLAGERGAATYLLALVGGPKRGQVTAPQRALLYLAVIYLAIEVPPSVILKVFNVLERTEVMRVKK